MDSKPSFIISKGNEFLVAISYPCSRLPRYSISPWDAAMIRKLDDARRIAKILGGKVRKFNPVTGVLE